MFKDHPSSLSFVNDDDDGDDDDDDDDDETHAGPVRGLPGWPLAWLPPVCACPQYFFLYPCSHGV